MSKRQDIQVGRPTKNPVSGLGEFIARYRESVTAFVEQGDFTPQGALWSRRDDATLANPLGPPACGWDAIVQAATSAAAAIRDGRVLPGEQVSSYATADLAYTVDIEHSRLRLAGSQEPVNVSLRVTCIFRREEDGWKVVHRHADAITSERPLESLV